MLFKDGFDRILSFLIALVQLGIGVPGISKWHEPSYLAHKWNPGRTVLIETDGSHAQFMQFVYLVSSQ